MKADRITAVSGNSKPTNFQILAINSYYGTIITSKKNHSPS